MTDDIEDNFWEDREAAKAIAAKFSNRIYVQPIGQGMVRIAFGEILDSSPSYHTVVVVTAAQALDFANVIYNMADLADNQAKAEMAAQFAAMQNAPKEH